MKRVKGKGIKKIKVKSACRTSSTQSCLKKKVVRIKKRNRSKFYSTVKIRKKGRRSRGIWNKLIKKIKKFVKINEVKKLLNKKKNNLANFFKKTFQYFSKVFSKKSKKVRAKYNKLQKTLTKKIRKNVWSSLFVHTVLMFGISYSVTHVCIVKPQTLKHSDLNVAYKQIMLEVEKSKLINEKKLTSLNNNVTRLTKDKVNLQKKHNKLVKSLEESRKKLSKVMAEKQVNKNKITSLNKNITKIISDKVNLQEKHKKLTEILEKNSKKSVFEQNVKAKERQDNNTNISYLSKVKNANQIIPLKPNESQIFSLKQPNRVRTIDASSILPYNEKINKNVKKKLSFLETKILEENKIIDKYKTIVKVMKKFCSKDLENKKCKNFEKNKLILNQLNKKVAFMISKKHNLDKKLISHKSEIK